MSENFRDRFCRHFQVPPEDFAEELQTRALYPRARLLRPLLSLLLRDHFAADREFVRHVGQLTQRRDFHAELKDFQVQSDNQSFLRGGLRLRISAKRMSRIFFEVWSPESSAETSALNPSDSPFTSSSSIAPQPPPKSV